MKRTQKSQKRTKFLFVLIVLTAILSITATYAWFSSQRDVEIVGMRINVEIAENMQISLDGETWAQSINIANMRQFYGTYEGTGDAFAIYQAHEEENSNYVPKELLPVSTIGEVDDGVLQFVTGTVTKLSTGKSQLSDIALCDESDVAPNASISTKEGNNAKHPYLVFDMYLRNVSAVTAGDKLQLNTGSRVFVDAATTTTDEGAAYAGTGIEYAARVAFIPYSNTADLTATGTTVRALSAGGSEGAAIWEPNDLDHTQEVVANNGRGITAISQAVATYGVKAAAAGSTIADVDDTTDSNLAEQVTNKPTYDASTGTTAVHDLTTTAGTQILLPPNKITKVRVYIWLEGQDPDCINTASTAGRLDATIKLTKPVNTNSGGTSYAD